MDHKEKLCADAWENPSSGNDLTSKISSDCPPFANFKPQLHQQKWEDPSILDYGGIRIEPSFQEFNQPSETQTSLPCNSNNDTKMADREDGRMRETPQANKSQDWDPRTMLNNLSFLEQKIHQLQDLVHLIVGRRGQVLGRPDELVAQQQQLITADLTSIIAQLISTAGSLLPSVKHTLSTTTPSIGQFGQLGGSFVPSGVGTDAPVKLQNSNGSKLADQSNQTDLISNYGTEQNYSIEEHESKDEEDADEGENLPPGSYEILQLEKEEILAPHTHFCAICGKGFKRDANLRMHMRGHGDEYKTPAALAKPNKESSSEPTLIKRYSCPYAGCKRNKDHKKFQPLKTILCVKNHYKRTHCDKSYTCSRCNTKKFSVIADLKTHEKHCGKDKWLCSCGTTFSRKDKLFGHIALFQGHTPAIPLDERGITKNTMNYSKLLVLLFGLVVLISSSLAEYNEKPKPPTPSPIYKPPAPIKKPSPPIVPKPKPPTPSPIYKPPAPIKKPSPPIVPKPKPPTLPPRVVRPPPSSPYGKPPSTQPPIIHAPPPTPVTKPLPPVTKPLPPPYPKTPTVPPVVKPPTPSYPKHPPPIKAPLPPQKPEEKKPLPPTPYKKKPPPYYSPPHKP